MAVRFFDQLKEDIKPKNMIKLRNQPLDEDKPGFAQFYCVVCGRHFVSKNALFSHMKTKFHKRMLKRLKTEKAHTSKDAYEYGKY